MANNALVGVACVTFTLATPSSGVAAVTATLLHVGDDAVVSTLPLPAAAGFTSVCFASGDVAASVSGQRYRVQVTAVSNVGLSTTVYSPGYMFDNVAPDVSSVVVNDGDVNWLCTNGTLVFPPLPLC